METLTRTCRICQQTKLLSEYHTDKRRNWRYTECKKCSHARIGINLRKRLENPEFKAQYAAKQKDRYERLYRGRYRERHAQLERWANYDLTEQQYQTLLAKQDNACACCHKAFTKTPNVDHDHKINKVRGLLCNGCNRGIGLLGDNLEGVMNAASYLRSR